MFDEIIFAMRLNHLRKGRNLTLNQLGEAIGATKATIGNLVNGNKRPSLEMAYSLADYFDVSLDYLVGRSDNPKINK